MRKQTPEEQDIYLQSVNDLALKMSKNGGDMSPSAVLMGANLLGIYRQLGRIADALESIIDDRAKDGGKAARIRRVWEE